MKTQQTEIQQTAEKYLDFFETGTRDNGEQFVKLKNDSPSELMQLVRDIHGRMMPDDYKYEYVEDAFQRLADYEDADDIGSEIEADPYNSDLLKWLSSNLSRSAYVEDYINDFLGGKVTNLYQAIGGGQYLERIEVFQAVRNFVENLGA